MNKYLLKNDLKYKKERKANLKYARALFDEYEGEENTIDDSTWDDLIMNNVYDELDYTYSSPGEAVLYDMLRNPKLNSEDLKKRSDVIEKLKEDEDFLLETRDVYYKLGKDTKNICFNMINGNIIVSKIKSILYSIISVIPFILIALGIILREPIFFAIISLYIVAIPTFIHTYEVKNVNSKGLIYLNRLFAAAEKLAKFEENTEIKDELNNLKKIKSSIKKMKLLSSGGGLLECICIPFLVEESVYYKVSKELKDKNEDILHLYYLVGTFDALASIAIYENNHSKSICKPKFTKEVTLKLTDGIHPLLENPVANSIKIAKKGIVLTGTNMSGKSTFLRMVSLNIVLAQSFNFVLAKEYEGCFFNVVSSLSPKDDIVNGKSYYMAEAEGILRIIEASKKETPLFCLIDEIFRGTNPVERISSSAEILKYLMKDNNTLCIVATHDKEISEILKNDYDFYYFSESVSNKKGLSFDYKLKHGVSKTRNAIKLLEYMGYPKEIINNSYMRIEGMQNYV